MATGGSRYPGIWMGGVQGIEGCRRNSHVIPLESATYGEDALTHYIHDERCISDQFVSEELNGAARHEWGVVVFDDNRIK